MKGRYQTMKKLMAILLMITLLTCLFTCFVSASPAPTDDTAGESEVGGVQDPDNAEVKQEFKFEPANFISNLYYMGVGMVGIFLVIGIIILCTVGLNRIFSGKAKE
jgi:hypothetical protein